MSRDKDDIYRALNEEQLQYLKEMFKTYMTNEGQEEIISDMKAGYITKKEAGMKIVENAENHYLKALQEYKAKYDGWPVFVHEYGEKL